MMRRRHWLTGAAACTAMAAVGRAGEAHGAAATITVIVPQPAGNPSDVFIRKLLPHLQRMLDRTLVVENLPGAGGSIGMHKMLNAAHDGHTLAMVSQTEPILTPLSLASARYKPESLRMLGLLGRTCYVLAGRADLDAGSLPQLLDLARRSKDRPLSFGHIGNGGMIHLLGAQWARACGLVLNHVPYRGVPPMAQELSGGQIDLSFLPLGGAVMSLLTSGRLRLYGSTAAEPIALLPDLRPLSVQEPRLRDFVHGAWGALVAPRQMPDAAAAAVHAAFASAMRDAEVLAFLRDNGTQPQTPLSLAALDQFYQGEIRSHQALARSVGIVAE